MRTVHGKSATAIVLGACTSSEQQCRLGFFQDSDFARDLEDSKSTAGGLLCIFGNPNICDNKLDVQETDLGVTQLNLSLLTQVYTWMEFPLSIIVIY